MTGHVFSPIYTLVEGDNNLWYGYTHNGVSMHKPVPFEKALEYMIEVYEVISHYFEWYSHKYKIHEDIWQFDSKELEENPLDT